MHRDLIRQEAEAHFREHGDTIEFKAGGNPNASYETIRGDLTVYAYGRTKDWLDAEDAVQETYCRILEQDRYPQGRNFGGLFKVILDAVIVDMYRHDNAREHINEEDQYDEEGVSLIELAEGNEVEPAMLLEVQEKVNFIMNSSNKMTQKAKAIIRMAYIFGYSTPEIVKALNVPYRKVTNTVAYFNQKLKKFEK
jgi:RNA polymerase sigma factor (sigma-70 family)